MFSFLCFIYFTVPCLLVLCFRLSTESEFVCCLQIVYDTCRDLCEIRYLTKLLFPKYMEPVARGDSMSLSFLLLGSPRFVDSIIFFALVFLFESCFYVFNVRVCLCLVAVAPTDTALLYKHIDPFFKTVHIGSRICPFLALVFISVAFCFLRVCECVRLSD